MRSSSRLSALSLAASCSARSAGERSTSNRPPNLADERAAVSRVAREHALHVRLAVAQAGLQEVLAQRPQQYRLPPIEARAQDECIEAVVLGVAAQHERERLLEACVDGRRIERLLARRLELEVLNPQRIRAAYRVEALADDIEAHVLEHRQRDVELDRLAAFDRREPEAVGVGAGRAHELDLELARVLVDQRKLLDVDAGARGIRFVLIRGREVLAEAVQEVERTLLGQLRQQRLAHAVLPRAYGVLELALQRCDVGLFLLRRHGPHGHRKARERGFGDGELALDGVATEAAQEDRLDRAPRARVVLIARQVHETRVEPAERFAAHEQLELVTVFEAEHADADQAQVFERRLEQVVARQRVQDVLQRLAAVAQRIESGLIHERADLHPQQRDRPRAVVIRDRREEPEEPPLHGRPAAVVEHLDADVIERRSPVNGRALARLRDHERVLRARLLAGGAREPGARLVTVGAQQTETGAGARLELVELRAFDELVLAVAEQREVIAREPFQEGAGFRLQVLREPARCTEVGRGGAQPFEHRRPILDGCAHRAQRARQRRLDRCEDRRVRLADDLEMNEGLRFRVTAGVAVARVTHGRELAFCSALHLEQRMDRHVDCLTHPGERHAERVDEKRHVVVRRLDDRVLRRPAVSLARGIENAHEGGARLSGTRPREMPERRSREHRGIARDLVDFRLRVVVREIRCTIDGQVEVDAFTRGANRLDLAAARVLLVSDGPGRHA